MYRAYVNEIGVKVLEESGNHDHDATLEKNKYGLPSAMTEKIHKILKANPNITPKLLYDKIQAEELHQKFYS